MFNSFYRSLQANSFKSQGNKSAIRNSKFEIRTPVDARALTMNSFRTLLTIACCLIISCSSAAENDFEKIVSRIHKYFSEKPIFLTSVKTIAATEVTYAYYSMRVDEYNLIYDARETSGQTSHYRAFLTISCKVSDNASNGDSVSKISEFASSEGVVPDKVSGFSTTSMAVANQDFSNSGRLMTIIIRYSNQGDTWLYEDISISGGASTESLVDDLKNFPQNKAFREAIGMP